MALDTYKYNTGMCDNCSSGHHNDCDRHTMTGLIPVCSCQCLKPKSKTATLVQPKRPREEVADLLSIINNDRLGDGGFFKALMYDTDAVVDSGVLTRWEANFLLDIRAQSSSGSGWAPSNRQLYTLRDIKDKLIEKGVI